MRNEEPSSTARLIAAGALFVHQDPKLSFLVSEEAAEASAWFLEACSPVWASFLKHSADKTWFRSIVRAIENRSVPGMLLHYAARKRHIESKVRQAFAQGVRQMSVLGGGFDTLALRLHREFPEIFFVELDHPATQRYKKATLEKRELQRPNFLLQAVDFRVQTLEGVLTSCPGYSPEAKTVTLMEGVLMYLSSAEVDKIFNAVYRCSGPHSRFIFTFMEPRADGHIRFRHSSRAVDLWLDWKGEPFTWGLRCEELSSFLESRGFRLEDLASGKDFRREYLSGFSEVSLAEGELVCVAERE